MTALLELIRVTRRFGARTVVAEASLELYPGRVTCLLGASGSGKSTLLRKSAELALRTFAACRSCYILFGSYSG